jgi:hypothetical protein
MRKLFQPISYHLGNIQIGLSSPTLAFRPKASAFPLAVCIPPSRHTSPRP